MHLEHINLTVRNIDDTLQFYRAAFPHWQIRGQGDQVWYGTPRHWLHFGSDDQYLAFNSEGEGNARDLTGNEIGLAHFAFVVTNLNAVQNRLLNAGYKHAKDGAVDPHRSNIYYIDPNGFEVEFVQYHSDLPDQRNAYSE